MASCCCFTAPVRLVSGCFLATTSFSGGGSWLGFIFEDVGCLLEASKRPVVTCAGETEVEKMSISSFESGLIGRFQAFF